MVERLIDVVAGILCLVRVRAAKLTLLIHLNAGVIVRLQVGSPMRTAWIFEYRRVDDVSGPDMPYKDIEGRFAGNSATSPLCTIDT